MRSLALVALLAATPAMAHSAWSNGEPIPSWVTRYCCSGNDVHRLKPSAVHIMSDGYHIDGIKSVIPIKAALPSQDGEYWAFFDDKAGDEPTVWCFFAPLNGV